MLRNLYLLLIIITSLPAVARQERDVREARPEGGIEALADIYHRIQFNEVQERQMRGEGIQLLFKVSRQGEAQLYKVQGIWERSVKDSLFSRNDSLPRFEPRLENGFAGPSFYALGLRFPGRFTRIPESEIDFPFFGIAPNQDDFELMEMGRRRMSTGVGIGATYFTGTLGEIAQPGLLLNTDVRYPMLKSDDEFVFGFDVIISSRDGELDLDEKWDQDARLFNIGLYFGYAWRQGLNALTPSIGAMLSQIATDEEENTLQEYRFGTALGYTRFIPIGADRFRRVHGQAMLLQRHLTISLRATYFFAGSELLGNGSMFNIAVGYSFGHHSIKYYRFKDSFYE